MSRDLAPLLPEKIASVYAVRHCAGLPSDGFPAAYRSPVDLSSLTLADPDVSAAHPPLGITGTTRTFRDTALALYSTPAGPATNQAALDALAKQTAQDYCDWRSVGWDWVLNGIAAVAPNGLYDLIEWRYDGADQTTRFQSAPLDGFPEELSHQDPAVSGCMGTDDRYPGMLVDVPGGASGTSLRALMAIEDGRLVESYDSSVASCGCGSPSCGTICPTFTASSTPFPVIAGVPVTVKDSTGAVVGTCVTDDTGKCCVPIAVAGTYTIVWPGTGHTHTITAACTTNNVPISTTGHSNILANLCGTGSSGSGVCCPSASIPATVTITGGGLSSTLTLTFTSCAATTLLAIWGTPASPMTLTWSAPGFQTHTLTSTAFAVNTQWGLVVVGFPDSFCWPAKGCITAVPSAIHATLNANSVWGDQAGTTVTLSRVPDIANAHWRATLTYLHNPGNTAAFDVFLPQVGCGSTLSPTGTVNGFPGSIAFTGTTTICPVAGSLSSGGASCTYTQ